MEWMALAEKRPPNDFNMLTDLHYYEFLPHFPLHIADGHWSIVVEVNSVHLQRNNLFKSVKHAYIIIYASLAEEVPLFVVSSTEVLLVYR